MQDSDGYGIIRTFIIDVTDSLTYRIKPSRVFWIPCMFSILYVDDEPGLLELGKLFLEQGGRFSVETVSSAGAALEILKTCHYDAIISDYQMPVMDGIAFLKQVRASGSTLPFIIFTGRGREEIVIQAFNEGADFYLQKGGEPVSQFAELGHKVQKAILQRKAEASIRDHERREADIINFLPDATFAIDTRGVVIAWNRAMETMTGVPAEQVLGKGNYEYAIPFYHERRPILIDLVLSDDPAIDARYPYVKRDGKNLVSEITIPHFNEGQGAALWFTTSLLYDTGGTVVGAIESIREITEWKRTEEALNASEQMYRTVFETTGTATILIENDATMSLVNSEFARLSGYRKDEIENRKKWTEFVVQEDLGRMLSQHRLRRQNRQDALTHYEFRFLTRSGEVRDIYLTIDVIPGTGKSVASLLDITERNKIESSLVAAGREYANLLDQIQDSYYRSDAEGRLVRASRSLATLLGYDDLSECIGRSIADDFYLNPGDRKRFLEIITRKGKITNYEVLLRRKDGTPVLVSTSSHVNTDETGRVTGIEGTFRDITERKRQERILRIQRDLGLALQTARGMIETLDFCLDAAIGISGLDCGGIYLVDEGSGALDLAVSKNLGDGFVREVSRYPAGSANSRIVMAGKPVYTRFSMTGVDRNAIQEQEGLRASAIIPVAFKTRITACLNIASHTLDEIPADARFALETIAAQIGTTVERIRADEALAESEQRYRNIVEDQTEFICRFRRDGTHVFVNEAYCRYFGLKREEIIGHRFRPTIPPDCLETIKRFFASLTPDHPVDTIEHKIIMPDGRIRWQHWSDRAIFDPAGTITEYQSVGRDITDRKETEEALRKSERQFRLLAENSQDLIEWHSADARCIYISPACKTLLDYDPEEITGHSVTMILHPDDIPIIARYRKSVNRNNPSAKVSFRIRHKDGHYIWFESVFRGHFDEKSGELLEIFSINRDITHQKRTEDALRQKSEDLDSRNRLISTMLDTIPIGIFMVEAPSGKPIIANREATRLLGRGILPDATEENLAEIYEAYQAGTSRRYPTEEMPVIRGMYGESRHIDDMVVVRPEGSTVQLEIFGTPVVDSQGRVAASLVSFMDITTRKQAEEALRIAREKYSKVFHAVPDAITVSGLDSGRFVEVNEAATVLFGYSREELIGKSASELGIWIDPQDREAFISQLTRLGRINEFEVVEKRKSGELYNAAITADTLTLDGEKFILSVIRDITGRKRADHVIREANRKINLLTSITRHDVANQVSIIRGFTNIALMKKPEPEITSILEKIDAAVSAIARQIEFTRAYQELGMHAPDWQSIRNIIAQQKAEGITLSCTCDADVYADPMLERVFFNLVDNAVRHGETVKTITVSCRADPDGLVIVVADDGTGVPRNLKERIFEKGYGKHTGFGLFLAREILAITGIIIIETGTPGKGAQFEIIVPKGTYRFVS